MWTRSELKNKAKADFKMCYWKAVLVSIILSICAGGSSGGSGSSTSNKINEMSENNSFSNSEVLAIVGIVLSVVAVIAIIGFAVSIFIFKPLEVGAKKFFLEGTNEQGAELGELAYSFKSNYKNIVLVQFMKNLFVALWTLLFIIPGIVKSYQYRMVSYILAEDSDISYKDALAKSKEMMDGQKWNAFVLDLSFILWYVLSGITLGIVYLFYVGPYVNFTDAELYVALKENN